MLVNLISVILEIKENASLIDFPVSIFQQVNTANTEKSASSSSVASLVSKSLMSADGKKSRGKREFREIYVETYKQSEVPIQSFTGGKDVDEEQLTKQPYFSGNPFVEKTEGILHLYKRNEPISLEGDAQRSELLAMLAVPSALTSHDLLQFLASDIEAISFIRIIRDSEPNQYMVLLKFRNQKSADDFYAVRNGVPFNTIEPDVCHLAYVARVETMKESDSHSTAIEGHTELPTCPVCLERMDESVDGILTILCNHSFHSSCLSQWGDTSCPVCRYCQTPELTPEHVCFVCGKQQDLWICLICGHIGCGRYAEGHANRHFQETGHTYSLQVGGQRVWDYAGDNYVHRLIQNKTDGKLVEFPDPRRDPSELQLDEKMDSVTLEYTYLLTSQLESQRLYFEERLMKVEDMNRLRIEELEATVKRLTDECVSLRDQIHSLQSEKQQVDKKLVQATSKLSKVTLELKEENEINKCVREDQSGWSARVKDLESKLKEMKESKEKEVAELQEQLRDLMFHLESEAKMAAVPVEQRDEIQAGQIVVGAAAENPTNRRGRRRNK